MVTKISNLKFQIFFVVIFPPSICVNLRRSSFLADRQREWVPAGRGRVPNGRPMTARWYKAWNTTAKKAATAATG